MKISNRLYVVTGCSSGLGLASSQLLHSLGAYVALFDLNVSAGQSLQKELGGKSRFWECDVGDLESVEKAFEGVRSWVKEEGLNWGGVVHAGGVGMAGKVHSYSLSYSYSPPDDVADEKERIQTIDRDLEPFNLETFKEVHRINLDGSFLIASHVASEIAKQNSEKDKKDLSKPENAVEEGGDRGVIILTSSVSATEGQVSSDVFSTTLEREAEIVRDV